MTETNRVRAQQETREQILERRRREAWEPSAISADFVNAVANPEAVYAFRRRQLGKGPLPAGID